MSRGTAIGDGGSFAQPPEKACRARFLLIGLSREGASSWRSTHLSCFPLHQATSCSFTRRLLTSFMLTLPHTAPAAGENRALPVRSILGWVSPLPELQYAGDSVGPPRCHLARAAARALLAVLGVEAQHGRRLATIQDGRRDVGRAWRWPRCGAPELPPHGGRANSLAQDKRCSTLQRGRSAAT